MQVELRKAVGLFVGVIGLVGTIVSILTAPSSIQLISFVLLFTALLVLSGWMLILPVLQKRKTERAIAGIELLTTESTEYAIDRATEEDIKWIAQLEAEVYSKEDAIPKHILEEWYSANPLGFFVIRLKNGPKIGHLDILPLRPRTLKQFLDGYIVERDIRGDCLYTPEEKEQIRDLYVESIIIRPPKGHTSSKALPYLLSNLLPIVRTICNPNNLEFVYAIAASSAGERLMKRLGFELRSRGEERKDRHPLFVARFAALAENVAKICEERFKDRALLDQLAKRDLDKGL